MSNGVSANVENLIQRENRLIRVLQAIALELDEGYSGNDPTQAWVQPALRAYALAKDALIPYERPNTSLQATGRQRCKVCGTTNHHTGENGEIVQNPPRA